MIQFAKAIGLELSSFTFKMLEDVLMKSNSKVGRAGGVGDGVSALSHFPCKAGSTVAESVVSRSAQSLPTISESVASKPPQEIHKQEL